MRNLNSKALDLFLLMFNISQLAAKEKIMDVFVEAIKEIWPNVIVLYRLVKSDNEENSIEISIANSHYGFVIVADFAKLKKEDQDLLHNAVGMLAIILKKNEQDKLLANEKLHLQKLVDEKIGAIKESEAKYRNIFENIQDVYYEALLDGTILEVSPSIKLLSKGQYDRNDLIGKSMLDFYDDPESRQSLMSVLREKGYVNDYEITLKNRDGSLICCSVTSKILLDNQGQAVKVIGGMRDITERKQAEDKTRVTQILLQASIESPKDMIIFSIDKDYHYLYFNSIHKNAMRIGYGKDVKQGMNLLDCITNYDDKRKTEVNCDRALNGFSLVTIEEYGDLERHYYETRYNPILNDKNEIVGATAFSANITERIRTEDELLKKMDELRRFQSLTVGRELAMIELKKEVNELLKKSGQKEKYRIVE